MALPKIENRIRGDIPQWGVPPYRQVHAHSTGNPRSTAQNEADYFSRKDINTGTYTHVVGNGRIIQVMRTGQGAWDVGGGWNYETYAAVELIESHNSKAEFMVDYKIYVDLLRKLAREAGLPTTLDQGDRGILTHNYCTYHQPANASDHVDPYPYLAKWGISKEQFAKDLSTGFDGASAPRQTTQPKTTATTGGEPKMMLMRFEIDTPEGFKKGEVWVVDYTTRTMWHVPNPTNLNTIRRHFKGMTGREIFQESVKKGWEIQKEFLGMGFKKV